MNQQHGQLAKSVAVSKLTAKSHGEVLGRPPADSSIACHARSVSSKLVPLPRYLTNMKYLTVSLLVAASCLLSGAAWAENVTRFDRFRLWDNCQPMDLIVASTSKDTNDLRLTKETIATAVRSRLRAARLYDTSALPFVRVYVQIVGSAFSTDFRYYKMVKDLASGHENAATSWSRGSTGTHGRDSSYILSAISEHTDEFIDEYLRVNEEACARKFKR